MKPIHARRIAAMIATDLFRTGGGKVAERLVLESKDGRDLGGWCEEAMVDRIEEYLRWEFAQDEKAPIPGRVAGANKRKRKD